MQNRSPDRAANGPFTFPSLSLPTARRSTGTSLIALEFADGVVIGADTHVTLERYVSNRCADKLNRVADAIYCCRSGDEADTQAIADVVAYHLHLHYLETGQTPLVLTAATIFGDLCFRQRDALEASVIVAGWDAAAGGQVYSVPAGGMRHRQKFVVAGSGAKFIYGYLDAEFKVDDTRERSVQLVTNGLALAMSRDAHSGGVIRLGVIDKNGIKKTIVDKLPDF